LINSFFVVVLYATVCQSGSVSICLHYAEISCAYLSAWCSIFIVICFLNLTIRLPQMWVDKGQRFQLNGLDPLVSTTWHHMGGENGNWEGKQGRNRGAGKTSWIGNSKYIVPMR